MYLTEPTQYLSIMKPSFLTNFTLCSLLSGLAFFDMTFWNRPTVFCILDKKNLYFIIFIPTEYDTTGSRLTNYFLNRGARASEVFFKSFKLWILHRLGSLQQEYGKRCLAHR